ncbi:hypothetical protein ACTVCO_09465 [Sanguibacter sp. A247]|uniref:hypothetical protein n=1 Tax=unclassified Sanguibacter TaxID=2645534 RepID=UPI003FD8A377
MTTPGHDPFLTPPPPSGAPAYGTPGQPSGAPDPQHGAPIPPYSGPTQPYGAPAQAYGAPAWQQPAPRLRKTLGAKIFTFLGAALSIGGIVMAASGISSVQEAMPDDPSQWAQTLTSIESPGTGTFTATAGTTYELITSGEVSSTDYEYVVVQSPSGVDVELSSAADVVLATNGVDVARFARFTATETGLHTIEVADGFDGVVVAQSGVFDDAFSALAVGAGLIVGAVLVGGLGFVFLLIGVIWWIVAASNNRKIRALSGGPTPGGPVHYPGM